MNRSYEQTLTSQPLDSSAWLMTMVSKCLNVPVHELDPGVPLTRYGMDSLASVEITAAISGVLDCEVPASLLFDCPNIESLQRYMEENHGGIRFDVGERFSLLDQMLADSVLPMEINPRSAKQPEDVRSILLTGSTGFLGAYLLRALLHETQAVVYCLTRPKGGSDSRTRIRETLCSYGLWEASFDSRIRAVTGEIQEPQLGLSTAQFDELSRTIDIVYHCAAMVNWAFSYSSLREVNVLGTQNLLQLACRHKRKPFHFVSSIGVCYSTAGPDEISEQQDMLPYLHGIHLGYAQSKCVAESLVRSAAERGLPAVIYRPALISGEGQSGISNTDDILSRLIKGCIQMRCAPDLDWILDCCPVNFVVDAVIRLTRHDDDLLRVFHLTNPAPRHWRESILWMNLYGYPIKLIPYRSWLEILALEADTRAHPLYSLRSFFLARPTGAGGLTLAELYEEKNKSLLSCDDTELELAALSLTCPPLNARLLDRYFSSFVDRGYLSPVARDSTQPNVIPELNCDFFANMLRRYYDDDSFQVHGVTTQSDSSEHSIIAELTSWRYGATAGLRSFSLKTDLRDGTLSSDLDLMVKMKPRDEEVMDVGESIAALCSPELGRTIARFRRRTGLALSHLREIAIYQQRDERFVRHAPTLYGTVQDSHRHAWILILEKLKDMELMDTADDVSGWRRPHIDAAVRGIADVHAIWYERESDLMAQPWLGSVFTAAAMMEMKELWIALANHADRYFADDAGFSVHSLQLELIANVGIWWLPLEKLPRTLIHNDFNPRNIALRRAAGGLRLCAYDWELATLGVPQHDLAELLCFVLKPGDAKREVFHFLEVHRIALQQATGQTIDPEPWRLGFKLSLYDLILNRFPMYAMVHTLRRQRFLQRVLRTWRALYELFPYRPE